MNIYDRKISYTQRIVVLYKSGSKSIRTINEDSREKLNYSKEKMIRNIKEDNKDIKVIISEDITCKMEKKINDTWEVEILSNDFDPELIPEKYRLKV